MDDDEIQPEISLVTPMYNEAGQIAASISKILQALRHLAVTWEYILVDDGSTDDSLARARTAMADVPNCRIIHYDVNRGRGYALRMGFAEARGRYVIATESDLSWGEGAIGALYQALVATRADIVIQSVYLPGGGLENVPLFRRLLSSWGNRLMRVCYGGRLTMISGMTRGYRREALDLLYLEEDRKEIHLEIVAKAHLLGLRMVEIPGTIRWAATRAGERPRGGYGILRFAVPHLLASLSFAAVRFTLWLVVLLSLLGFGLVAFGLLNKLMLITPRPTPNLVNYGLLNILMAAVGSLFASVSLQISQLRRSLVHMQSQLKLMRSLEARGPARYPRAPSEQVR